MSKTLYLKDDDKSHEKTVYEYPYDFINHLFVLNLDRKILVLNI